MQTNLRAALHCRNICKVIGTASVGGKLAIAMPLYPDNLFEYVKREYPSGLPIPLALDLSRSIVRAVHEIHVKAEVLHLNLKPENILIKSEGPRVTEVVLTDLAHAELRESLKFAAADPIVQLPYTSPEQLPALATAAPSRASDVYTLGYVLKLIFSGEGPWPQGTDAAVILATLASGAQPVDVFDGFPMSLRFLVGAMLDFRPDRRPATKDILSLLDELIAQQPPSHSAALPAPASPAQPSPSQAPRDVPRPRRPSGQTLPGTPPSRVSPSPSQRDPVAPRDPRALNPRLPPPSVTVAVPPSPGHPTRNNSLTESNGSGSTPTVTPKRGSTSTPTPTGLPKLPEVSTPQVLASNSFRGSKEAVRIVSSPTPPPPPRPAVKPPLSAADLARINQEIEGLGELMKNVALDAFFETSSMQRAALKRDSSGRREEAPHPSRQPEDEEEAGSPRSIASASSHASFTTVTSISYEDVLRLMTFSAVPIQAPLFRLRSGEAGMAVWMFRKILAYCSDILQEDLDTEARDKIAHQLVTQAMQGQQFMDELYLQLIKQSSKNPRDESLARVLELFAVVCACGPPSKELRSPLVTRHLEKIANDAHQASLIRQGAAKALALLRRSMEAPVARAFPPILEELAAVRTNHTRGAAIYFVDGSYEEAPYDIMSTVGDVLQNVASTIHLNHWQDSFGLFIAYIDDPEGPEGFHRPGHEESEVGASGNGALSSPGATVRFNDRVFENNHFFSDVLAAVAEARWASPGQRIPVPMLKKRFFREADIQVADETFHYLNFLQLQYEYLQGSYPVVPDDALYLCALLLHANGGASELEMIGGKVDAFIPPSIAASVGMADVQSEEHTKGIGIVDLKLQDMRRQQWRPVDAQALFVRFIQELPHGHSRFFMVERQIDPLHKLPSKTIIGVNQRGIHLFRPSPREYVLWADLRDIRQFGSKYNTVFFVLRMTDASGAAVDQTFQFGTSQGEEICRVLNRQVVEHQKRMEAVMERGRLLRANSGVNATAAAGAVAGAGAGVATGASQSAQDLQKKQRSTSSREASTPPPAVSPGSGAGAGGEGGEYKPKQGLSSGKIFSRMVEAEERRRLNSSGMVAEMLAHRG